MKADKLTNGIFYIALTIEIAMVLIDKSALTNPIEGRLFQLTFLLFACKLMAGRYTLREWGMVIGFGMLGVISYLVTGRNEIIRIVVLIAACKDMDMRKVLSYMFWTVLSGCLLIVVLSLAGIMGQVSITDVFRGNMVETRYCLGMGHPNALHCMFFMLVLLGLYVYGEKLRLWHGALLTAGNFGLFFLTGSKTGTMAVLFAVVMAMVLKYNKKLQNNSWIYRLVMMELFLCVAIAWTAAACSRILPYHENLRRFDRLLSDRIVNLYYDSAVHAGTLETWTWWGIPENEYYFDLGWVRLFYWYGIIPACIYIVMLFLLIRQLKKNRDYMGAVMLASVFLYTLVEAHVISVYTARDYTLFLFGAYWCGIGGADRGKADYFWKLPALLRQK